MGFTSFFSSLFQGKAKAGRGKKGAGVPSELDIKIKPRADAPAKPKRNHAAPESSEEALGFRVAGGRPDGKAERRRSYRVSYEGLVCRIQELQKVVRVRDISATGLGLLVQTKRIKAGTRLHLVLGADGKALVKGLVLRVVRHEQGILGGEFEELDRHHEDQLNQLVLDAQKRRAEKRHKHPA